MKLKVPESTHCLNGGRNVIRRSLIETWNRHATEMLVVEIKFNCWWFFFRNFQLVRTLSWGRHLSIEAEALFLGSVSSGEMFAAGRRLHVAPVVALQSAHVRRSVNSRHDRILSVSLLRKRYFSPRFLDCFASYDTRKHGMQRVVTSKVKANDPLVILGRTQKLLESKATTVLSGWFLPGFFPTSGLWLCWELDWSSSGLHDIGCRCCLLCSCCVWPSLLYPWRVPSHTPHQDWTERSQTFLTPSHFPLILQTLDPFQRQTSIKKGSDSPIWSGVGKFPSFFFRSPEIERRLWYPALICFLEEAGEYHNTWMKPQAQEPAGIPWRDQPLPLLGYTPCTTGTGWYPVWVWLEPRLFCLL